MLGAGAWVSLVIYRKNTWYLLRFLIFTSRGSFLVPIFHLFRVEAKLRTPQNRVSAYFCLWCWLRQDSSHPPLCLRLWLQIQSVKIWRKWKRWMKNCGKKENTFMTMISLGFGDRIYFCSQERIPARRDTYSAGFRVAFVIRNPVPKNKKI